MAIVGRQQSGKAAVFQIVPVKDGRALVDVCAPPGHPALHFTASLTAFTGLALTALLAGFAANFCFCLVKGLIPSRAGRAGFFTTTNLAKPCRTNTPVFFSSL